VTMAEQLEMSLGSTRGPALLITTFGLLALALAMIGVYGVVSYTVSQRSHEFGVRMALGARGREIVDLVLRRGVRTAFAGVGVGLLLAAAATQVISGFVFGVDGLDPILLGIVSLALAGTTLVACGIPALLAARVDPMTVLRCE